MKHGGLRRIKLGIMYTRHASLFNAIEIPPSSWTPKLKLSVIQLLELEATMDQELAGYLIADGDEAGMEQLMKNQKLKDELLWLLKQDLNIA